MSMTAGTALELPPSRPSWLGGISLVGLLLLAAPGFVPESNAAWTTSLFLGGLRSGWIAYPGYWRDHQAGATATREVHR